MRAEIRGSPARRQAIRLTAKLLGYVTFLAPILVLAFWGAAYLYDCINAIAAPGAPLIVRIQGQGGMVTLRAESYAYDFWSGGVVAREISVTSPTQIRVARAESVTFHLPDVLGGPRPSLDITIRNLDATLERDVDGKYTLVDLLPEPTDEPSLQPYRVDIEGANILLLDRSRDGVWAQQLRIPRLKVDGVGDRWRAVGDLRPLTGGSAILTVESRPQTGISIRGQVANLELSRYLAPLRRTPELADSELLRDLGAASIMANGSFWAVIRQNDPAEFSIDLKADARSIRYGDFRAQTAIFQGKIGPKGAWGQIEADDPGVHAVYAGNVGWDPDVRSYGRLTFEVSEPSRLPSPLRKELPAELSFRSIRFEGVASLRPDIGFSLHGGATAESVSWNKESVQAASFMARADSQSISLRGVEANYKGNPLRGAGDIGIAKRTIHGFAETESFQLQDFRDQTGLNRIYGTATAEVFASGSLDRPRLEFRTQGDATVEIEAGHLVDLGEFHGLAILEGNTLRIDRLAIAGPTGVATAFGTYGIDNRQLNLQVVTTGIDLADLHSQLDGTAIGRFAVTGTIDNYLAKGPVEMYGLVVAGQSIPLVAAQVSIAPNLLSATEIRGSRGAGRLRGEASWQLESGMLAGSFTAKSLQLNDFTEASLEGSLDVREGRVSGTIDDPIVEGRFEGRDLVAESIRVDLVTGQGRLQGSNFNLEDGVARIGNGELSADGSYDWKTGQGTVGGNAQNLPISRVQPLLPSQAIIEGLLSGTYHVRLANARMDVATVEGKVDALSVNGSFFGSGPFEVSGTPAEWIGSLQVGQPERYVEVSSFRYRPEGRYLTADLLAYELPIQSLFLAARPYLTRNQADPLGTSPLPPELLSSLDTLRGRFDLSAQVSGTLDDPTVVVESLMLRDTTMVGDKTGEIDAIARREAGKWSVEKFRWTGGPGILDITGSIEEQGAIALDGNLNNFDTQWLSQFIPTLGKLTGDATLFFSVTGQTNSPLIEASLSGSFLEVGAGKDDTDKQLKMELYPILISEGEIKMDGTFAYRGFNGTLTGKVPFHYPFLIPEDEIVEVSLKVDSRPLKDLKELILEIDEKNTEGTFGADVRISGKKEAIDVTGNIHVDATSLAFLNIDTTLRNVKATGTLSGQSVRLDVHAEPSKGGTIDASMTADTSNFAEALRTSFDKLLANKVEGTAYLKNFRMEESHGDSGSVAATANGGLRVSGSLGRPVISTFIPIALENVRGTVPSVFESTAGDAEAIVQPEFRVAYIVGTQDRPAEVSATSSQLSLYGGGTLIGRLDGIKADATLRVASGSIRLPNARIRLLSGGTVRAIYDASLAEPELRLDVDIEGRTSLSTLRFTNLVERYEIYLDIRGNLLDPAEQLITARSDPPELTSDRILSLLGQIELFQSLSGQFTGDQNRGQLERTLTGLALPVVFDPVTEAIARQFGLEYLSVNYGPLGQTDVTLAKFLGKGFTIQGRREISEPIDGVADYDIRLTYRPPRSIRSLRDLVFSIGVDEQRPWKISVEYSKRFRNGGATNPSNLIRIGPELPPPTP